MSDAASHPTADVDRPFRVLALDGGGIKGAFSAAVLATIEEMNPGVRVADHFDLICGTSTGGILAIGLGLGLTAGQVLEFYLRHGPAIFPKTGIQGSLLRSLWQMLLGPKYSARPLRSALADVFGDRCLGASTRPLVIPSYDATRGGIKLFKTAHDQRLKQDYLCPAVDVALGTSAAPTYFEPATTGHGDVHIDGGIWANTPVVVGILEAHMVFRQALDRIEMLSIGTTDTPFSVTLRQGRRGAMWTWKRLATLVMQAQMSGSLAQSLLMIGDRLMRVNPLVQQGRFTLDNVAKIGELQNLGASAARHAEGEIRRRFISPGPAAPFTPFYAVPAV